LADDLSDRFGPMMLVADAGARSRGAGSPIAEIQAELARRGFRFRTVVLARGTEIEEAVHQALVSGDRLIVAAGDDRTVHHTVNGMIEGDRPVAPDAVLGVLPVTDSDILRTFGLPEDHRLAIGHLEGATVYPTDLGKATCAGRNGEPVTRYFVNIAQAGLGGAIANRLDRGQRRPGRVRRFLAFWGAVARFDPARISVVTGVVGSRDFEGLAHNVFVANGQSYGGGMRISPRSWPGDGLFDVLVMTGPKSEAFTLLPSIYRGEHLPHPHIVEVKARSLTLETERPWPVEVDGIPLGTTPARFELIRQPIRLKV